MTDYDPRADTGIPTEPVGSLPRPVAAAGGVRGLRRGQDRQGRSSRREQDAAVRDSIERVRGDRLADHLRRRAALVELRDLPDHRHARRHRPGRPPRPAGGQFFAIFADGHDRQLPRLTGGPFRYKTYAADTLTKSIRYAHQADEAGRHRAVDARAALPAGRRGRRATRASSSRRTWSTSARRTSARRSRPARRGCRSTSPRAGWRPAPTRATRGPARGMLPHFIELNNRVFDRFSRRGAAQHRRAHLPGRRPRLGAQRRRAVQRPAAAACSRSTPATSSSSWPASATRTRSTS